MKKILDKSFFNRSTLEVAQDLIGKFLVRTINGKQLALQITEVEAYDGPDDKASHGRFGKTDRNKAMFGPPGSLYIYKVYGLHLMLNIATDKQEHPSAVLIRGAGHIVGPGKLAKRLDVEQNLNEKVACPENGLWFEDRGIMIKPTSILKTPRIGIDFAGSEWAMKPYRFLLPMENLRVL